MRPPCSLGHPGGWGKNELALQPGSPLAHRVNYSDEVLIHFTHTNGEVLSPTPTSSLVPGPFHLGETLTASGQQIIHDDHLLPWLQSIFLDFQLSLWTGSGPWCVALRS